MILFMAGFSPLLLAGRIQSVAPISLASFHGGAMTNAGSTQKTVCISADMQLPPYQSLPTVGATGILWSSLPDVGVTVAREYADVEILNVGRSPQHVVVNILPGSTVSSRNSTRADGTQDVVPSSVGPSLSFSYGTSEDTSGDNNNSFDLSAGSTEQIFLETDCNLVACQALLQIASKGNWFKFAQVGAGTIYDPNTGVSSGAPQVCLWQSVLFNIQLAIREDRGAILAHLSTGGHRVNGYVDHFPRPPYAVDINGGRPF